MKEGVNNNYPTMTKIVIESQYISDRQFSPNYHIRKTFHKIDDSIKQFVTHISSK